MSEYPLFCLGNPLLGIQVNGDQALLDKYGLKPNDAILAEEKHLPIYEEITTNYSPNYLAGGAAQNAARGAQYMLPPKSVVYVGCAGQDAFGEALTSACVNEGVLTKYRIEKDQPTGRCGVIITGHDRSMVTDLAAANHYRLEHLQSPEIWSYVENAKIYYVGGYHLTVCVPAILALGKHAADTGKIFTMNLSAPFLLQFFKEQLDSVASYWDYVIGNESEALAYSESHGLDTKDITEIAKSIANLPKKNTSRPRVVVITQGTDPTVVVTGGPNTTVEVYPIRPIESKDIVDTNGAGDAFAGGFLAGLIQGKDLKTAADMGHWLASWGVREPGPAYPSEKKVYGA
ncbi:Ribokinase-like protein [Choiromyces venosus 120613-1]|uniref:Adenosine kinase n=1 Tax=Choiromyces venosus 120613-1 TaxID=1336337 RepID=A0A3N4K8T4_9PEZI|nr:Ribokinase-like protein [Choiromyces venosus 120613-1]